MLNLNLSTPFSTPLPEGSCYSPASLQFLIPYSWSPSSLWWNRRPNCDLMHSPLMCLLDTLYIRTFSFPRSIMFLSIFFSFYQRSTHQHQSSAFFYYLTFYPSRISSYITPSTTLWMTLTHPHDLHLEVNVGLWCGFLTVSFWKFLCFRHIFIIELNTLSCDNSR